MSTLTKVLIVLLTIFSIFLCGIVVTYVAHAENQKQRADTLQTKINSAQRLQEAAEKAQADAETAAQRREAALKAEISDLNMKITKSGADIAELTRLKEEAERKATAQIDKAAIDANVSASTTQLYVAAQEQIKTLLSDQTERKKDLDELNMTLMDKMAQLAQYEEKNRQLAEANQEISNRLNQYLQQYGKMTAPPKTATVPTGPALPAAPQPTKDIALSGRVVDVDLQNNLAQISLGAAEGVKPNMRFHVIRGEQFICDIVIVKIDPDKSVGQLSLFDRSRAEPRIGDAVSTNL